MNYRIRALLLFSLALVLVMASTTVVAARSDRAPVRAENALWAGDSLYGTILTPATFKNGGTLNATDRLFNFDGSGLMGQRAVAEAAPGMSGYNGGRWWVMSVQFTEAGLAAHDADGDGYVDFELTNAGMVMHHAFVLGHLTITPTEVYFECPLLKSK